MILEKYDESSIIEYMAELIEHIHEKTNDEKIMVVTIVGSITGKNGRTSVIGYDEASVEVLLIHALKGLQNPEKSMHSTDLKKILDRIIK